MILELPSVEVLFVYEVIPSNFYDLWTFISVFFFVIKLFLLLCSFTNSDYLGRFVFNCSTKRVNLLLIVLLLSGHW